MHRTLIWQRCCRLTATESAAARVIAHAITCRIYGCLPPAQGNYAAANAAVDASAAGASAAGRPCVAVQWGVWAETGMAAAAGGLVARLARQASTAHQQCTDGKHLTARIN